MSRIVATALERARAAWGEALPDWVEALALAADATSLSRVNAGYSTAALSNVINRKYKGRLDLVERAVRFRLMKKSVVCPVLGEIDAAQCADHQRADFTAHNPQKLKLYRACHGGCPNASLTGRKP